MNTLGVLGHLTRPTRHTQTPSSPIPLRRGPNTSCAGVGGFGYRVSFDRLTDLAAGVGRTVEAGYSVAGTGADESIANGKGVNGMANLPAWTSDVSDSLIDVKLMVDRAAVDGVFDAHEYEQIVAAIEAAQSRVTGVHRRIAKVCSIFRHGDIAGYHGDVPDNVVHLFGSDKPQTAA